MRLSEFLVLLLVFSGIIIGGSTFMGSLASKYDIEVQNLTVLSKVEAVKNETETLKTQLESTHLAIPVLDIPFAILSGAYTLLKLLVIKVPDLWFGIIMDVSGLMGIPSWASSLVMVFIISALIFEIIAILVKWRT